MITRWWLLVLQALPLGLHASPNALLLDSWLCSANESFQAFGLPPGQSDLDHYLTSINTSRWYGTFWQTPVRSSLQCTVNILEPRGFRSRTRAPRVDLKLSITLAALGTVNQFDWLRFNVGATVLDVTGDKQGRLVEYRTGKALNATLQRFSTTFFMRPTGSTQVGFQLSSKPAGNPLKLIIANPILTILDCCLIQGQTNLSDDAPYVCGGKCPAPVLCPPGRD